VEGSRKLVAQSSVHCSLPWGGLWPGCPFIWIQVSIFSLA